MSQRHLKRTQAKQRTHYTISSEVWGKIAIQERIEEIEMERQMEWLGHLARMGEDRMLRRQNSRQALFGQLRKTRPFHGMKMSCMIAAVNMKGNAKGVLHIHYESRN